MKTTKLAILFSVTLIVAFAACKNSNPTSSNSGTVPSTPNTLVMTVSGKQDTLQIITARIDNSGTYPVISVGTGSLNGMTLVFTMSGITTTGTVDLGTVSATIPPHYAIAAFTLLNGTGTVIDYGSAAPGLASYGSISITSLTSAGVQGTFHATLPLASSNAPSGTPTTVAITNGGFNATYH